MRISTLAHRNVLTRNFDPNKIGYIRPDKSIKFSSPEIALEYAFYETKADAVQLNVFSQNTGAVKCYKSIGFVERKTDYSAFGYKDELWDRCNMVIKTEVK